MQLVLTPVLLIEAYKQGLFPMAYSGDSPYVHWICPDMRGQLPIEGLHIPKRLKKTVLSNLKRNAPYEIRIDTAFEDVIRACAGNHDGRPETWINEPIIKVYCALRAQGHAHSVECWDVSGEQERLVGGLYGLAIGGAFFGESMFSHARDASKIALVHLAARLWKGGYSVLDTQFVNEHLKQFGVYELPHKAYMEVLRPACLKIADFNLEGINEHTLIEAYFAMRADGEAA